MTDTTTRLMPLSHVRTTTLDVAYFEAGRIDGAVVILLHGYPYDIHSYVDVIPALVESGHRVIVPYLRGHGATRFLDQNTPRSGQQAALGADVLELMDALWIERAILAGYDWGGRAACVAAALWPDRVSGIVSVNSYLIQDISVATVPIQPDLEAGFWYFYYFLTDRGRAGLTAAAGNAAGLRRRHQSRREVWLGPRGASNLPTWRRYRTSSSAESPAAVAKPSCTRFDEPVQHDR